MRRFKPLLFPMIVAASIAAAIAAGAVWASGTGRPTASAPLAATCSSVPLPPADQPVDTNLDKMNGLLTYSLHGGGSSRSVTIEYKNPECLGVPALAKLISHVLATDAEAQAQTCASFREQVAANVATVRGIRVNLDAAKQYISEWC